ncbi:MAG: hypothetical protein ACI8W7_001020 [Gammaproteobacteria bacterium]|jgi:hypothetical protein
MAESSVCRIPPFIQFMCVVFARRSSTARMKTGAITLHTVDGPMDGVRTPDNTRTTLERQGLCVFTGFGGPHAVNIKDRRTSSA